jgi:phage tail sheath protein FI
MAEYLAPGVYVEEVSFRGSSIEGVGTSTTAFVGMTRTGPVGGDNKNAFNEPPELLTKFGDFQRIYGSFDDLNLSDASLPTTNYLAHEVKAFFDNGGSLLYVSRAFTPNSNTDSGVAKSSIMTSTGVAAGAPSTPNLGFVARFPGSEGNGTITVDLVADAVGQKVQAALPLGSTLGFQLTGGGTASFWVKQADGSFKQSGGGAGTMPTSGGSLVTIRVTLVSASGAYQTAFDGMGLDPSHPRYIGNVLAQKPTARQAYLENMFGVALGGTPAVTDLVGLLATHVPSTASGTAPFQVTTNLPTNVFARSVFPLSGGNDGGFSPDAYGNALVAFEPLEDISIVAAPGSSAYDSSTDNPIYTRTLAVQESLLAHVERPRAYRVAVLDPPQQFTSSQVRDLKSNLDSNYAALYYPWVHVTNPLASPNNANIPQEIDLPPSGYACGIYARTDFKHGVFKAPANEVVLGALRFETDVSFGQQSLLNPLGVNCLRHLPNRGNRVWGARTISSDPDWKYISVRRYMVYLEASIDYSTQWAVFESNGPQLWSRVASAVSAFLRTEWRNGALLGDTPEQAYFVKCDRGTMTQNDLDNGRMVCLIGVAVIKPAEFVIFRIGQKTADASS